ncbi:hypothetical protein NKZ03_25170 [Sinorhizobium meliloti]|uniref:hypothetical protein n=1 Tax=Rhizobium meliloti TaxID=382 RepID=UPI0011C37325|nr:hypothetical protein [Sinorhizobium meliloti]MDW9640001.1 hypothetical protein [Sinorhizobium meliloti]MDW9812772.1 hypothetical protein [Sinorhizobium meliloti]MDX0128773.1 hypothetical protein [Sinorhizobium meliloti]MDX0333526.1 hypothetical protein [Sinorhizobium meliloti]QPI25353.1 hypothetical protein I0J99_15640 [Sinorhizobium meliloti]
MVKLQGGNSEAIGVLPYKRFRLCYRVVRFNDHDGYQTHMRIGGGRNRSMLPVQDLQDRFALALRVSADGRLKLRPVKAFDNASNLTHALFAYVPLVRGINIQRGWVDDLANRHASIWRLGYEAGNADGAMGLMLSCMVFPRF